MSSKSQSATFLETVSTERGRINRRCEELIGEFVQGSPGINESVTYCLLNGGKRLRAMLCLWTHDLLNGERRDPCLDAACAIECMHAYSLVHDDLPCMDDDAVRRGKPSCHKKFGEAMAVLTGDALLTLCFEIIASLGERWDVPDVTVLEVFRVIARAGGADGLITGQALDILAEGKRRDDPEENLQLVEKIHRHKTAKLIAASMEAGAICADADSKIRAQVTGIGMRAGQAFQIVDDILDIQTDAVTLGKTPGKDVESGKLTYPSVLGITDAKVRAAALIQEAERDLAGLGKSPLLTEMMEFILNRAA
ncbi:MAG: hypothetical protein GTO51_06835 [Candidatus Latescibacteria bacterium]|nr:hypothetical protein [Candidatus Latescibacterota bacterium]NIM21518.1 hypothetical protein [Candidatus Latescibacterota bacterium]NIM65689.1 hypothetical protein [Candidatus Latescibacterota bacterium]NIO02071.1 hypothetical protein [Candidatus Latescibacterota bacterium]NIO28883.1 hypothetical protein [Candidatus Latescibacterota bacterium]